MDCTQFEITLISQRGHITNQDLCLKILLLPSYLLGSGVIVGLGALQADLRGRSASKTEIRPIKTRNVLVEVFVHHIYFG